MALSDIFTKLIGSGATYAGPDQGLDFTGSAPVYSLGPAVVTQVEATGGWYNGGILVYQLLSGSAKGRYVYTAENFSPAAGLKVGSLIKQGQKVGVATGTGAPGGTLAPGIETGFSQSPTINPYGNPQEGKGSNPPDPQALSFKSLVTTGRVRSFASGSTSANNSLAQLWIQAGGSPSMANLMAAIAMAESAGNVGAVSPQNSDGTVDQGLWQINSSHTQFDPTKLTTDPLYNAQAAVSVFKSQGLGAWSTYTNGAYQQFLGTAGQSQYSLTRPGGDSSGSSGSGSQSSSSVEDYLTAYQDAGTTADRSTQTISFLGFKSFGDYVTKGLDLATLGLFSDGTKIVGTIGSTLDALKWLIWLLQPKHILQMVEFLTGIALMVFGIQAAVQGRGENAEGFQTGEAAISRSGLGRVSRELAHGVKRVAAPEASAASSAKKRLKPASAPHKVRRTALKVRYEREQQVSNRNTAKRRGE